MFRKRMKNNTQTEYACTVRFLDDEPVQFSFKKETIGQWLFDRVAEKLNLLEKDYFGLRYVDTEKQRHWLDPLKTVYKQLKGVSPMTLCFRVKFYPEDPMKLHEEITRYYLFLQLRRDLHHGRLLCSPDDAVCLASFIVQSEVGDYDPEDHPPGYISEFKMLPKQTPKLEEGIMGLHKTLHGQVPSEAESNFLKKTYVMETYGVDPFQVKDQRGEQLYLGITYQGIVTFRGSRRTNVCTWAEIRRIAYEGKVFMVHITQNEKSQAVAYKCQTSAAAKYMWRCAVEQQLFFTLSSSTTVPKMRSGGSILSRRSKFRFRSSSLPNFARRRQTPSNRVTVSQPKQNSNLSEPLTDTVVDTQHNADTGDRRQDSLEPSPVVKAPLVVQEESYDDERRSSDVGDPLMPSTAGLTAARPNGHAVTDAGEGPEPDAGSVGAYEPDITVYSEDDRAHQAAGLSDATPSLDDEIKELDDIFTSAQVSEDGCKPTDPPSSPSTAKRAMKLRRCKACFTFAILACLLAALFYAIFFSSLDHPIVQQARSHLSFLEPTRDGVAELAESIAAFIRK